MIPRATATDEAPTWTVGEKDGNAFFGTMKMTEVFNFGVKEANLPNYEIIFATSEKKDVDVKVTGDGTLAVAKEYINNEAKHATTVVYNYGKISSKQNDKKEYEDVTREAKKFETIYNCIYNSTYTWNWATREQLNKAQKDANVESDKFIDYTAKKDDDNYVAEMPYVTELIYGTDYACAVDSYIYGTSAWDGIYSYMLNPSYKNSLKIVEAKLTSDTNGEEEYFKVETANGHITGFKATATSSTTNPTKTVPSTLTIKCMDMYGHSDKYTTIKVAINVKQRLN